MSPNAHGFRSREPEFGSLAVVTPTLSPYHKGGTKLVQSQGRTSLRTANTLEARDSLYNALEDRPGLASFLHLNEGFVSSVAFSPDGKAVAAGYRGGDGGDGGGVVVWDAAARERLAGAPLPVPEGFVSSVAFSPDGKALAAGYYGGVVLWDVDLNSWQRRASQIANRNFTRDEWRQYFPDEAYRPTFPDLPVPPEETSTVSAAPTAGSR
jgi:WD40 repeat protein